MAEISQPRKTTCIQLNQEERNAIDEYSALSGMDSLSRVVRHFTIPAVKRELPELRERHRRRMEALGADGVA